jgi:hypothetical protein
MRALFELIEDMNNAHLIYFSFGKIKSEAPADSETGAYSTCHEPSSVGRKRVPMMATPHLEN